MKNKILYIIGLVCGLTTLIVGLLIFFTWWFARAYFAVDLNQLEGFGFMWSIISFFIAGLGLLLLIIVLIINIPKYLIKNILSILIILINIPALYGVLLKQADIDKRAYIKIVNLSGQNKLTLSLSSSSFNKELGSIDNDGYIVRYFYPKYLSKRYESILEIDSVTLTIVNEDTYKTVLMPDIRKGECMTITIGNEYKIKKE